MNRHFPNILACLVVALLCGCPKAAKEYEIKDQDTRRLENRDAIARLLPPGLKLEDQIPITYRKAKPGDEYDIKRGAITVEHTLIDLGAMVGPNNQIQSKDGLEIVFVEEFMGGTHFVTPRPTTKHIAIEYKRVYHGGEE
jgi:hypothetical protein